MFLLDEDLRTSGASEVQHIPYLFRGNYRPLQVSMTGVATVVFQGRNDPDLPWVNLLQFTESGAAAVALMREVRADMTGNDGAVSVELDV
jgi:hypothetical protein